MRYTDVIGLICDIQMIGLICDQNYEEATLAVPKSVMRSDAPVQVFDQFASCSALSASRPAAEKPSPVRVECIFSEFF